MKLSLAEPKYLKDSISIISDLVNEARFKITPDSMELVAMDPANVAMVIFKLLSSAFIEYDIKDKVEIAINLTNFKQILRRVKPSDILTLELSEENRLKITLKGTATKIFSLPIIEIDEKEQKVPDLEFPVTIQINSNVLNEAIEDVGVVADSVSFVAEKGKFVIEAKGDLNKARIEVPADDSTKIIIGDESVRAKYSIEYLKKMIGGSKLTDEVVLKFNKDYPLKIEYKSIDKVSLSFILAPRIEED